MLWVVIYSVIFRPFNLNVLTEFVESYEKNIVIWYANINQNFTCNFFVKLGVSKIRFCPICDNSGAIYCNFIKRVSGGLFRAKLN